MNTESQCDVSFLKDFNVNVVSVVFSMGAKFRSFG